MNFLEQNQPVHTILGDNEFEAIRGDMATLGVAVNRTAREEHVPEIERQQWVIKERARAAIQTLPYRSLQKKMANQMKKTQAGVTCPEDGFRHGGGGACKALFFEI